MFSNSRDTNANKGYFDVFKKYDKIRMILGGHNHFYARMNAVSGTEPILFMLLLEMEEPIHTKIHERLVLHQNNMSKVMELYIVMSITKQ